MLKRTRYIPKGRKLIIDLGSFASTPQLARTLYGQGFLSYMQVDSRRGNRKILTLTLSRRGQLGPIELLAGLADEIARLQPASRSVRSPWNTGDHTGHVNVDQAAALIGDAFRHSARTTARQQTHVLAG